MSRMQNTNQISERVKWIDVLKFLGIFAIYLGHFCESAGKFYPFVFTYHVPLFFLCSGFFAEESLKSTFIENIFKKMNRILFPYYIFGVISLLVYSILNSSGYTMS